MRAQQMKGRGPSAVAGWLVVWICWAMLRPPCVTAQDDSYEEWLEAQREDYQQFLSEQDRAFLTFLRQEWKRVEVDPASRTNLGPKPASIPTADPETGDEPTSPPDATPSVQPDAPAPRPADPGTSDQPAPAREEPAATPDRPSDDAPSDAPLERTTSLSFFGTALTVPYEPALTPSLEGPPGQVSISTFWIALSRAEHEPFVAALERRRRDLALGDWGYYQLVRDVARQLYGGASDEARLLTWFVMIKSGYAARVGYTDDGHLFLLLPSDDRAFKLPQLRLDGQRYYIVNEEVPRQRGALHTYDGQYPEATRTVDFAVARAARIAGTTEERTLHFTFRDTRHELSVAYDAGYVEYLQRYPKMELSVYFTAALSPTARQSLRDGLRPLLNGKSEEEAVNLLLRFVQRAFDYKRDTDHFGEERYLFPEETLAASYSDCEDRAALFAYLARELLGVAVVGLKYPGHVAAAVQLQADAGKGVVTYGGDRYVVADPTYFGADVGMVMPFVQDHEPTIIALDP